MTPVPSLTAVLVYNRLNNEARPGRKQDGTGKTPDKAPEENMTMQQAIYNTISISHSGRTAKTGGTASQAAGLLRWVSRKWDLVGVVALLGSSAAYGVFALAHMGL